MARRRRTLELVLIAAAIISGSLICILWVRSYWRIDGFVRPLGPDSYFMVESNRGRLTFDKSWQVLLSGVGQTGFYSFPVSDLADSVAMANSFGIPMSMPSRPGVGFERSAMTTRRVAFDSTRFTFPHWWLLVASTIFWTAVYGIGRLCRWLATRVPSDANP